MTTYLPVLPTHAPSAMLGTCVHWTWPTNHRVRHAEIVAALTAAGLDARHARELCRRHGFVRALRKLESDQKLITIHKPEPEDALEFSFNAIRPGEAFPIIATGRLEKKPNGALTLSDPALEGALMALLVPSREQRTTSDLTRLINRVVRSAVGAPFKFGHNTYFIPAAEDAFRQRLETLLASLSGDVRALPVPDVPAAQVTVTKIVTDGLEEAIYSVEEDLASVRSDARPDVLARAEAKIAAAADTVERYAQLVLPHRERLTDYLASVRALLSRPPSALVPDPAQPLPVDPAEHDDPPQLPPSVSIAS